MRDIACLPSDSSERQLLQAFLSTAVMRITIMELCFATALLAQSAPGSSSNSATPTSQQSAVASSPSKSIGMFTFAKNGQNAEQQAKDENECYGAAKQQSGVDPQAPPPATKSADQKVAEQKAAADSANQAKGGRVRGAARGAAAGATIGAIAGDAGKGAAAGAAAGTMKGGMQQRQANAATKQQAAANTAAQQEQQQAQANAAHAQNLDAFKRAFSACMDARGYSVK